MTLVLLDVDGTLSNSLAGIQAGFRDAMAAIDHSVPDEAFMNRLAGPPMIESLYQLGLDEKTVAMAMTAYMSQQKDGGWAITEMFPGWPNLLKKWKEDGLTISTATSKGEFYTSKVLELFGIDKYFDYIAAADETRGIRTKTDVIQDALHHFHIAPGTEASPLQDIVMVGDRIHDFASAKALGVPCIAAGWGYGDDEERQEATRVAHSVEEVDHLVHELTGISKSPDD